jgi:hypothetical protein
MRSLALVLLLMLSSPALADENYSSVEQYIDNVTKGLIENYDCHISADYPKYRGCSLGSPEHKPNISRVFGMLVSQSDGSGFVFVLEPNGDGLFNLIGKSRPFTKDDLYMVGVEGLIADSNDRFHIQYSSGSLGQPNTNTYRFKLINGQWRITGLDHNTLARCNDSDGSEFTGEGSSYSANFLTGDVLIKEFNNCKLVASNKTKKKFPIFLLSDFTPLDERYELK